MKQRVHAAAARAVQESAEAGRDEAKARCPVRTGTLRGTIETHAVEETTWRITEGGPTEESPEGADYAPFVNFGTRKMSPRPHFVPGVETARQALPGAVTKAVRETLEE